MKLRWCFPAVAAAGLLAVGAGAMRGDDAEKNKRAKRHAELADSMAKWVVLRDRHNGNYEYEVRFRSWVGHGHTTTIVVRGNQVVQRRFRKFNRNQGRVEAIIIGPDGKQVPQKPPRPKKNGWTETGKDIGSHKEGAAAVTVDTLYEQAAAVLNKELKPHHKLYLLFHGSGVLRGCFYVDTRIADDVPRHGPRIDAIRMAKPAASQPATSQPAAAPADK